MVSQNGVAMHVSESIPDFSEWQERGQERAKTQTRGGESQGEHTRGGQGQEDYGLGSKAKLRGGQDQLEYPQTP